MTRQRRRADRNADCHSKNIALCYTDLNDIAYTPAYDVVTTQACPRYAQNPPGLSIEGRKLIEAAGNENRWRPVAKQLTQVRNDGMASLRSVKSEPG